MLEITSLKGDTLPLIDTGQPERIRDIDGTHRMTVTIRETDLNSVAFAYIENEAILTLDNDKYVIKNIIPRVISDAAEYEIEAEHKFKHDTGTKWIYDVIKGRKVLSLHEALSHCLPPNYTFTTYDDFTGYSFEDFGDDWSLALFEKARVSFNFEYIKDGTHLKIYKQIGNKTNKQMRHRHNIVNIEGGLDSTSLATYIEGVGVRDEETGEPLVSATYTSPLAETYDILDAKPVDDERFHNQAELLEYMKSKLQDTVDISYDITYDEFIKALDDDTDVDLGDSIYLKHEVLNEDFQTRIVAVTDYPLSDTLKPIYTISSKKESIIDRQVKANLDRKNLESQVNNLDSKQTEAEKRIEKAREAVADVEHTIDNTVIPEMERLENEVIPEIEQAVDSAKIPSSVEPPYPIPTSNLWWDTSINPPRLRRWDGSEWVVLAPNEDEIDVLLEDMRENINYNIIPSINESPTGFQIEAPKLDINSLVEFTNRNTNLLPMHPSNWENGYIGAATGNENDRDYALRMIDFLTVEPNTVYTINAIAGANVFIREYEEDRFVNNHPTQLRVGTPGRLRQAKTQDLLGFIGVIPMLIRFILKRLDQFIERHL